MARAQSTAPARVAARDLTVAPTRDSQTARRRSQRRQRELRFRRRRLDLLQDLGLAVVATVFLITVTAGLGVVLLLVIAAGAARVAWVVVPRLLRRRQRRRA